MKIHKVTLPNGHSFTLKGNFTDFDIERLSKAVMDKAGILEKDEREIVVVNTPLQDLPEYPEPKDYTKPLRDIAAKLDKQGYAELLKEVKELNKGLNYLCMKIDRQTQEMVKTLNVQNDVLAELVVAYKEPKKIVRDSMGRPEGIE